MRREAFVRWPVHGNVLSAFREGRLEIGPQTLLEPGVWLTAPGAARIRIGSGNFLNLGVMVAALDLVEIGDHCMFANGCFISDSSHRYDSPLAPVPWQGFTTKGPTRIGDNQCSGTVRGRDRQIGIGLLAFCRPPAEIFFDNAACPRRISSNSSTFRLLSIPE